jgi:hypothetical protein
MSAKLLFRLALLLFFLAAVFGFEIINFSVSLTYETDRSGDCISTVTGRDLCASVAHCKLFSIGCLLTSIGLLFWGAKLENRR